MQAVSSSKGYEPVQTNLQGGSSKTTQVLNQAQEVVELSRTNISKLLDRGDNLQTIQNKTEAMSDSANQFRKSAKEVRRKMWWQSVKMKIILAVILVVLALVIVGVVLWQTGAFNGGGGGGTAGSGGGQPQQPAPAPAPQVTGQPSG
ncbi:Vesicle-associated membrane protein 4 [Rhizophlyctis rosea]|nr:Vesicle-associated membrane protein 4 [Rhizophlyctis rosea]